MSPSREEIKNWLKTNNLSYEWLAEKCLVKYGTVKNWMAKTEIPPAKLDFIKSLMEKEPNLKDEVSEAEFTLEFTDEEMKVINKFREAFPNLSLPEYARGKVDELCSSMTQAVTSYGELEEDAPLKAAEEPAVYGGGTYSPIIEFDDLTVAGNIAAGGLMEGDTIPYTIKSYRKDPKGAYALRVCGYSMDPPIPNDSLIVVSPWKESRKPKIGSIVVYSDERGVTLKKLEKKEGKYILVSTNPEFPDIEPLDGGKITAVYVRTIRKQETDDERRKRLYIPRHFDKEGLAARYFQGEKEDEKDQNKDTAAANHK